MSFTIRVMHPDYDGYSRYSVDAIEIGEEVTIHSTSYGSLIIFPTSNAREELRDGLPK